MVDDLKSVCRDCDGIGTECVLCKSPITECECGPDAEPCTCERCNGTGNEVVVRKGSDLAQILGDAIKGVKQSGG